MSHRKLDSGVQVFGPIREAIEDTFVDVDDLISRVDTLEQAGPGQGFTELTEDGELTADRSSYDPATEGTGVFTLPTPTVGLDGARRGVWRVGAFHATDYISIIGHIEGNASGERRMGLLDEHFIFVCNGTTWLESGHSTQAFCTPIIEAPTTFALTTGFTKFTAWDTLPVFDTAGRLKWNSTNSQIDVPVVESIFADGYKILLNIVIEYTVNRTVTGIIAVDGVPINGEFPVNGGGSGKPLMLHIPIDIGFPAGASTMEVQLKGEIAGTLDVLSARWTVNRIKA